MPLKLALIVVPPLCICCMLLRVAGVPWNVTGRIAGILFGFLALVGICDRLKRREETPPEQEEPSPDHQSAVAAPASEAALGLGESAIADLPVYKYEQKRGGGATDDECAVCLGEIRAKEMVKQLPVCTHLFHEGCIDTWLRSHRTCPVCRTPVDAAAVPATVELESHAN